MTILITGASGFVGRHLVQTLRDMFDGRSAIVATSRRASEHRTIGSIRALDVTNRAAVDASIADVKPSHIVHLAGLALAADANANPAAAWQVHVQGTLNVAHAILQHAPNCTLIFVGTGHVYGASARSGAAMDEQTLLAPTDEYSATKATADLALGGLVSQGLRCVRLRPFNHTGPGQREDFAVPAFAMQIARVEAGLQVPVIRVGDLAPERDYLDVRDVTRAYALAIARSADLPPGTVLNIASGTARSMRSILEELVALSGVEIEIVQDAARMRVNDLPRVVGDAAQARRMLKWEPKHALGETLAIVMEYCRGKAFN